VTELQQAEKIINLLSTTKSVLPSHFPKEPQTKEDYLRLCVLPLNKQLSLLNAAAKGHQSNLENHLNSILALNKNILKQNFMGADELLGEIYERFGYSHLLLRKAVLIKNLSAEESDLKNTISFIERCGLNRNVVSSIIHCYQEEQDYLSIKRSIMGTTDYGDENRFTRDVLRIAFHPLSIDENDLSEQLLSCMQSSLIDGVLIAKVNQHLYKSGRFACLEEAFKLIDDEATSIDEIAKLCLSKQEAEDVFYQQSSAWLENTEVIKYRLLQDHFYDSADSGYLNINGLIIDEISDWIADIPMDKLNTTTPLTSHAYPNLQQIENSGTITRSSIFNFLLHKSQGMTFIAEDDLIDLMGKTSGLSRTIDVSQMKAFASCLDSEISKTIAYLLIAKKSKNELDGHQLRRILQNQIIKDHSGSLVQFVSAISSRSTSVARYTYDVCTEDFIARLSHIIKTSKDITDTRAALHRWMGDFTGDNNYFDRARNLIIDHQINKVKDELDDHRIYADAGRFMEWMEDEIAQVLSTLLLILEHNNELHFANEPQLFSIIEKCYFEFCSNKLFGVASYLGRRIRHGTFKGHLYSHVISLESDYEHLLAEPVVSGKWSQWKNDYETHIDAIVKNKLHIKTAQKKQGFLNPYIKSTLKQEITNACMKDMVADFQANRRVDGSLQIIAEYCWRIAEVDLKAINAYLKNQKTSLINHDLINSIKLTGDYRLRGTAKDFSRDLQRRINDKLSIMYGWFKRPQSVAPKASLGLLYKAVVAEVAHVFRGFCPETDFDESDDIEIEGGAYHVLYDAFYVIVFNAAKHGKEYGRVCRHFNVINQHGKVAIQIEISSENKDGHDDDSVNKKLKLPSAADIDNAQMHEDRSGIVKLYHLEKYDKRFNIEKINCENKKVLIKFHYELVHG